MMFLFLKKKMNHYKLSISQEYLIIKKYVNLKVGILAIQVNVYFIKYLFIQKVAQNIINIKFG